MTESTEEIISQLGYMGCSVELCGSRVTCDPAPTNTDYDYLVVSADDDGSVRRLVDHLGSEGFKWEGNEHYQIAASDFMSWRRGEVNLIITRNHDFAQRHRAATFVCKRLNLLNKPDRIALFQAVLYGHQWSEKSATAWQERAPEEEIVF